MACRVRVWEVRFGEEEATSSQERDYPLGRILRSWKETKVCKLALRNQQDFK